MKRALQRVIAIALLVPTIAVVWLTLTESGLRWTYQHADSYLPAGLTMDKLEGRLFGPITIIDAEYKSNGVLIHADQIDFDWNTIALLIARIDINSLQIKSLKVILPQAEKTDQPLILPDINLPWRITFKNVIIDGISVTQNDQTFDFQQARLTAATFFNQINIDELIIKSNTFNLAIKGEIHPDHNYRHELEVRWQTTLPSNAVIKGHGRLDGDIKTTRIKQKLVGPVQLTLNAEVNDLFGQLNWQGNVNVSSFDTSKITTEWSAINGQFKLDGKGDLTKAALSGTLIGNYPELAQTLDAQVNIQLDRSNNGINVALFDVHSKDFHFNTQGRVGEKLTLDWSIDANDLAKFYPQARGQLRARGLVTGHRDSPIINATFKGKALSLPGYVIGTIDGDMSVDPMQWQHINIKLAAQALTLKGYELQSLEMDTDTHHLIAKATSEAATALIELKGDMNEKGWRGRIERADIKSRQFADWQLKSPATLDIREQTVVAENLCWRSSLNASLCASLQRDNSAWLSHLEMSQFPLHFFSPWLPPDLTLEGIANATANLRFQAPDDLQVQAHIALPAGAVSYPLLEGERDRWEYLSGIAELNVNNTGLEVSSEIAMPNGDQFHGRFALPGLNPLALNRETQPLQASAQLKINDLGLIEAITPEVHDLRGEVALNLSATGTLAQPQLIGRAHLLNGALRIPRLGLTVDQITLKAQSDGFETLNFHLDAHSGEGNLAVEGKTTLDRSAGWPTEVSIKGKGFLVSSIPEARVQVSPDLRVTLKNNDIDIRGEVHVPTAKLQPKDLTTAARVSKDVVIINSDQKPEEKWSIFTQVRLTLGERVDFYGFGFEGRFGGSLLLSDRPGQLTTATGELSIPEGRYRAYGQRLDVEHGRLLFTGGPLSNPGLDLRAVRHINEVTAGLRVRGSLSQPQIELFSIPAMGQTDTLSYLMLGRPIENTTGEEGAMMAKAALALGLSGGNQLARSLTDQFGLDEMRVESSDKGDQASLVMGRYLSPRLYVSYGVGLIESFNTFTVRYRVSNRWHIKGESGEQQGADILYTIDR